MLRLRAVYEGAMCFLVGILVAVPGCADQIKTINGREAAGRHFPYPVEVIGTPDGLGVTVSTDGGCGIYTSTDKYGNDVQHRGSGTMPNLGVASVVVDTDTGALVITCGKHSKTLTAEDLRKL